MADLLDARPLRRIRHFGIVTRNRAESRHWHEVDSRPCECDTLHGHCPGCPCGRHEGEVGARW
jgi:hypothetical protein